MRCRLVHLPEVHCKHGDSLWGCFERHVCRSCPPFTSRGCCRGISRASGLFGDEGASDSSGVGPSGAGLSSEPSQQPDRAALLRELEAARAEAEGWRALHSQLHAFCVDQLLPAPT